MSEFTEDQEAIVNYLNEKVVAGHSYFKAKDIEKDLKMSPYSIGGNLFLLSKKCKTLKIIQWSCSTSITWRVEKAENKAECI